MSWRFGLGVVLLALASMGSWCGIFWWGLRVERTIRVVESLNARVMMLEKRALKIETDFYEEP